MSLTPRIDTIETKTAKNIIINGGMDFFQRELSVNATYDYNTADRWLAGSNLSSLIQRSTDIPAELVGKVNYSLKLSPDAVATPATSDYGVIEQWVEGNFAQAVYGKDLILKFWFKSNKLGTYSASMQDPSLLGQTFVTEFEVVDTGWNSYTISIPHSQANQAFFSGGNGKGFVVSVTLMSGTDYQTSGIDVWETGAIKFASSNQVNFYDSLANECYLTGVILTEEVDGDIQFSRAGSNYQEELMLCQRYFISQRIHFRGIAAGSGRAEFPIPLITEMRDTPIIINNPLGDYSRGGYFLTYNGTIFTVSPTLVRTHTNIFPGGTISTDSYFTGTFWADAEL